MQKKETKELVRVKAKQGSGKKLADIFKVTTVTVSRALNGKAHNEKAIEIRKKAVELGGDPIFGEIPKPKQHPAISGILSKEFGVTPQTVRNAIKGLFHSETAKKIRKAAVELK